MSLSLCGCARVLGGVQVCGDLWGFVLARLGGVVSGQVNVRMLRFQTCAYMQPDLVHRTRSAKWMRSGRICNMTGIVTGAFS